MVPSSEIVATATVSFLLGWALRSSNIIQILRRSKNLRNPSNNLKLALVVRTDLGMSKGKIASQCSHAALANYKKGLVVNPAVVRKWESLGEPKVILRTNTGAQGLKHMADKAESAGLVANIIRDAGRTQIPAATPTVLGIGPDCATKIDKITSNLPLL